MSIPLSPALRAVFPALAALVSPSAGAPNLPPPARIAPDELSLSPEARSAAAPAPMPAAGTLTVRHGDTLAKLAREHLGDASRWKELYALNQAVIGPNPNLIVPGMVLQLPPSARLPEETLDAPAPEATPVLAPSTPAPAVAPQPTPVATAPAAPKVGIRPLALHEYPKAHPVGAHGIPNFLKSREDADFVLNLLGKVGARNTLLIVPFPSPTELRDEDRYFLEQAKARGITVQLRLGWDLKPPMTIDPAALTRYTRQVAEVLGAGPYVQIANEPNLHHEWADGHKPDATTFARWWAPLAQAVAEGGGYPGLPGLAAGAWNTPDGGAKQEFEFYEQMLATIVRESPAVLDRAWTAAHPYHMYADAGHPDYVEDLHWQLGRYNDFNERILGRSLPILVTESGYVDGENARRFDPNNAQQGQDVARFKASLAQRPDWLLVGTADWLISNRHGSGWRGMYGPNGEPTPFAQALESQKGQWEALQDTIRP